MMDVLPRLDEVRRKSRLTLPGTATHNEIAPPMRPKEALEGLLRFGAPDEGSGMLFNDIGLESKIIGKLAGNLGKGLL